MITETKGKERVGQSIGRYRLERYASGDSVSDLYLAYDTEQADPVTIQIFSSKAYPPRSETLAAFRQAQRRTQGLRHPAIARIIEVGVTEKGELYVVMDFIIQTTLRSYLRQREEALSAEGASAEDEASSADKAAFIEEALSMTAVLGGGLAAALQMGLVHNDLRLDNVAISIEGQLVLMGLNTPLPEKEPKQWLAYRSPEQREGKLLDARSNVYSLGAILYELLLGLTPPENPARTLELLQTTYKDLPEAVHRLLQSSLAQENWARFQTMRQMLAALDDVVGQDLSLSAVDAAEGIPLLTGSQQRSAAPAAPIAPAQIKPASRLLTIVLIVLLLTACGLLLSGVWPVPEFVQSLFSGSTGTEEPLPGGLNLTETPGAVAGVVLPTGTTTASGVELEVTPTLASSVTATLPTPDNTPDNTPTEPATPTVRASTTMEPEVVISATATVAPTATATATQAPAEPGVVRAPRWTTAPTIDGDLAEWASITPVRSEYVVFSRSDWNRVEDSMAWWRLAWDETNLYVAVAVVDDIHVQEDTGSAVFLGDSLEMQFDTTLESPPETVLTEGNFQIMLSAGDFETLSPEAFRFRGTNSGDLVAAGGNEVLVSARKTEEGYGLEAAIPWTDLEMTPEPGMRLGLALNANDNDVAEASIQEVMMSNVPERTLYNPSTWGVLILEG